MDILKKTIQSLTIREAVNYKMYANRTKNESDRKDILLFDLFRNTFFNDADDDLLFEKLYHKDANKNTFHRLKSRLQLEVDASIIQFYFHKTDAQYIHNEIGLYKIYIQKNEVEIALYHLKKAEKKAIEVYDYLMLDAIYTEFINFCTKYNDLSPNIYIKKRQLNYNALSDLRTLDEAIANIVYELKQSQNLLKVDGQKTKALNKAIKTINTKKEFKNNVAFQSKLYTAISNLLLTQKDYGVLEHYCIKTFTEFIQKKWFAKHNHQTKIQLLMYACNTLFINKKYALALNYIKLLKVAIHEFKDLLYDNYIFFYYNSLANNYSVMHPEKTISVLNEAIAIKAIKNNSAHLGYIYLNLTGAYFDNENYKMALKVIIDLYKQGIIDKLNQNMKLTIYVTDIILRIELGHFDYVISLIKTILKDYKIILKQPEYKKNYDLLFLFKKTIKNNALPITKTNQALALKFQTTNYNATNDTILKYKSWLDKKFGLKF